MEADGSDEHPCMHAVHSEAEVTVVQLEADLESCEDPVAENSANADCVSVVQLEADLQELLAEDSANIDSVATINSNREESDSGETEVACGSCFSLRPAKRLPCDTR
eukprot:TRINITY_DN92430_c0_g1_i1.p1 TRINITY_DN92430_c0_g1~~TRINITY_DN92430_c0_g1_i1.p1  ORF type:complete len:107 (-),score=12.94 TRINITY_DN92430_c0_g1_i1:282-602(-)